MTPSKIIYKERWIPNEFAISKPEHFAAIVLLDVVGFFSWHRFLISFALLFNFTLVFGKTVGLKLISLLKSEFLHRYFSEEPDQKYA